MSQTEKELRLPNRELVYKTLMARSAQIKREWDQENSRPAPLYPNSCDHGGYLFSFVCKDDNGCDQHIDLYQFDNYGRLDLCMRYGPGRFEYYWPGPLSSILTDAAQGHDRNRMCVEELRKRRLI